MKTKLMKFFADLREQIDHELDQPVKNGALQAIGRKLQSIQDFGLPGWYVVPKISLKPLLALFGVHAIAHLTIGALLFNRPAEEIAQYGYDDDVQEKVRELGKGMDIRAYPAGSLTARFYHAAALPNVFSLLYKLGNEPPKIMWGAFNGAFYNLRYRCYIMHSFSPKLDDYLSRELAYDAPAKLSLRYLADKAILDPDDYKQITATNKDINLTAYFHEMAHCQESFIAQHSYQAEARADFFMAQALSDLGMEQVVVEHMHARALGAYSGIRGFHTSKIFHEDHDTSLIVDAYQRGVSPPTQDENTLSKRELLDRGLLLFDSFGKVGPKYLRGKLTEFLADKENPLSPWGQRRAELLLDAINYFTGYGQPAPELTELTKLKPTGSVSPRLQ